MVLFLLAALPLFFVFVTLLPWDTRVAPSRSSLFRAYLEGLLLFVPAGLLMLILRKLFGFSWDGFSLYLSLLLRDHLVPLLLGLAGLAIRKGNRKTRLTEEKVFLTTFSFLCGFFSLMSVIDFLFEWGGWDPYVLFLLPALRMTGVLIVSLAAGIIGPREDGIWTAYGGIGTGVAVVLCLSSFLFRTSHGGWAAVSAVVIWAASIVLFASRFPRSVSGLS